MIMEQTVIRSAALVYLMRWVKVQYTMPQDVHGNWNVPTNNLTAGIYIIRMEADGKTLQTQRLVVVGK